MKQQRGEISPRALIRFLIRSYNLASLTDEIVRSIVAKVGGSAGHEK